MSTRRLVTALVALGLAAGCVSNPTPHPGTGGELSDQVDTSVVSEDKGPDRDGDGVPDCEQRGGFWADGGCEGVPASVADVTDGPEGDGITNADEDADDNATDAVDGDVGDVGPYDEDDGARGVDP